MPRAVCRVCLRSGSRGFCLGRLLDQAAISFLDLAVNVYPRRRGEKGGEVCGVCGGCVFVCLLVRTRGRVFVCLLVGTCDEGVVKSSLRPRLFLISDCPKKAIPLGLSPPSSYMNE